MFGSKVFVPAARGGGGVGEGGGVLRITSDGDNRVGVNLKPQKIPRRISRNHKMI